MLELKKFWAPWCSPCRAYAPVVDKVVEGRNDVYLSSVNIDEEPQEAALYDVKSVPTTVILKEGVPLGSFTGPVNGSKLNKILDSLLDM